MNGTCTAEAGVPVANLLVTHVQHHLTLRVLLRTVLYQHRGSHVSAQRTVMRQHQEAVVYQHQEAVMYQHQETVMYQYRGQSCISIRGAGIAQS